MPFRPVRDPSSDAIDTHRYSSLLMSITALIAALGVFEGGGAGRAIGLVALMNSVASYALMRLSLVPGQQHNLVKAPPPAPGGELEVAQCSCEAGKSIHVLTALSHDVQTPLTRMRLRLELADSFPEQKRLLCDLQEAEQLIREGMAFARNSHIKRESAIAADLNSFIESTVRDYQETGRPVRLIATIDAIVKIKPLTLRRILSNFIDNALKYAGAADVTVSCSRRGGMMITVLDRGPGIPADKLERVKDPFVRLLSGQEKDEIPGSGLGLAIAHQLAGEMNARIELENREGGGLAAHIILPAEGRSSA